MCAPHRKSKSHENRTRETVVLSAYARKLRKCLWLSEGSDARHNCWRYHDLLSFQENNFIIYESQMTTLKNLAKITNLIRAVCVSVFVKTRWVQCCAEEQCESMFDCNRNDSKRHFGLLYCWLWRLTIFSSDKNKNKKTNKELRSRMPRKLSDCLFFLHFYFFGFVQHQQHNHHVWRYIKPFYFLCVNIHCAKKI